MNKLEENKLLVVRPTNDEDIIGFIRNQKPSQMVRMMVQALYHGWIKVDMDTFGDLVKKGSRDKYICVGCAMTNYLCELKQRSFDEDEDSKFLIRFVFSRFQFLTDDAHLTFFDVSENGSSFDKYQLFSKLETTINALRIGNVFGFFSGLLIMADYYGYRHGGRFSDGKTVYSEFNDYELPPLQNDYTLGELELYLDFAERLESINL